MVRGDSRTVKRESPDSSEEHVSCNFWKKVIGVRSPQSVAWADALASVIDSKMLRSYGCLKSGKNVQSQE